MDYHHLTPKEREKIEGLWKRGMGIGEIAKALRRNASTISREIKRNGQGKKYRGLWAHACYLERRAKCRRKNLFENARLVTYISGKLILAWSPEQISGRLLIDYPHDPQMRVSHSCIYRWLAIGMLPRSLELKVHLRHHGHRHGEKRGVRADARELRERSRLALRRKRLGDWEVDTIVAGRETRSFLLNMTDRKSRYCCLALIRNTKKASIMRAFTFFFGDHKLPLETMTSDRGAEFNCHREFEKQFGKPYYFTRPASPWQKPTVENTNGLIRQFFPRGTDFSELSNQAVVHVMDLLNNRPRKCLGWKTPAEIIFP